MISRLAVRTIRLYQRTLSPDHGWRRASYPYGFCRHAPSCSEYAATAIERFGLLRGGVMVIGRIARCAPWTAPRFDPVPNQKNA